MGLAGIGIGLSLLSSQILTGVSSVTLGLSTALGGTGFFCSKRMGSLTTENDNYRQLHA